MAALYLLNPWGTLRCVPASEANFNSDLFDVFDGFTIEPIQLAGSLYAVTLWTGCPVWDDGLDNPAAAFVCKHLSGGSVPTRIYRGPVAFVRRRLSSDPPVFSPLSAEQLDLVLDSVALYCKESSDR